MGQMMFTATIWIPLYYSIVCYCNNNIVFYVMVVPHIGMLLLSDDAQDHYVHSTAILFKNIAVVGLLFFVIL